MIIINVFAWLFVVAVVGFLALVCLTGIYDSAAEAADNAKAELNRRKQDRAAQKEFEALVREHKANKANNGNN